MNALERLKKILGLGFAASEEGVIEEVESQAKTLKEIRETLGLPPDTSAAQVKEYKKTQGGTH